LVITMFDYWTIPFLFCGVFTVGFLVMVYKQRQELQRLVAERERNRRAANEEDDIEKQQKLEAVQNGLVLQEWKDVETDDVEQQPNERPERKTNNDSRRNAHRSLDVSYHTTTDNELESTTSAAECGICLIPFQHQDLVGSSTNDKCCHYFHKDCITEWLSMANNDDCPFCRETFLVLPKEEDAPVDLEEEDNGGGNDDAASRRQPSHAEVLAVDAHDQFEA